VDSDGLFNFRFVVFRIIFRFQSRFRSAYQADRWQDKDALFNEDSEQSFFSHDEIPSGRVAHIISRGNNGRS